MYHSTILVFCFVVSQVNVVQLQPRIAGGTRAVIKDFPYLVSVRIDDQHTCSGTILDPDTVITAASCVNGIESDRVSVHAGSTSRSTGGKDLLAREIQSYPQYNPNRMNYDVALIHLEDNLPIDINVQPIRVFTQSIISGWTVKTVGWGALKEATAIPDTLQSVQLQVQNRTACRSLFPTLGSSMFCVGATTGGKGVCDGDAGSPLVYNQSLIGIVSLDNGCGLSDTTALCTQVPTVKQWIFDNMNE